MAYSNTKKPAFYIPMFDYLHSIGQVVFKDDDLNDIHLINPAKTHTLSPDDDWWETGQIEYEIDLKGQFEYKEIADADGHIYIFILGHNFHSTNCMMDIQLTWGDEKYEPIPFESVVNSNGNMSNPSYNGLSIIKAKYNVTQFDGINIVIRGFSSASNDDIRIGCVSLCSKWTPPHNPDLSLTMSRQYDGVKTTRTKGGATLSNAQYTRGGTFWTNNYAWELSIGDYDIADDEHMAHRNKQRTLGRRIWSMNFSYLTPANLMPEFESLDYYETEYNENLDKNIHESQSFFARVLNRVQGSHLPFIFNANDTDSNYNPDQWSIVRFDQKDFKITQAAPELYSLSMKLTESY